MRQSASTPLERRPPVEDFDSWRARILSDDLPGGGFRMEADTLRLERTSLDTERHWRTAILESMVAVDEPARAPSQRLQRRARTFPWQDDRLQRMLRVDEDE